MYYIIETRYAGTNTEQHLNSDCVEIHTAPAYCNKSHEICLHGWAGTTNDWATYAHGEYESVEAAKAAIAEQFGDVRDSDSDDPGVIAYLIGAYEPMNDESTGEWVYQGMIGDVTASTTDAEIEALAAQYESDANAQGYTLAPIVETMMTEYRNKLKED